MLLEALRDTGARAVIVGFGDYRGALEAQAPAGTLFTGALEHRHLVAAAKLAPDDAMIRTAAAVGAFTKGNPVRAFGRLGPLTGEFPKAAVVRFHLGLLLLWTRQLAKGADQFRLAIADEPHSIYATEARQFLAALAKTGTK